MLPTLPVAHGDADDGLCAVRAVMREDGAPRLLSDGMDAEHRVGGALHGRTHDAEPPQLRHGALIAHGDERHTVAKPAHRAAGKHPRDGADPLRVKRMAEKIAPASNEPIASTPCRRRVSAGSAEITVI